MSGHHDDSEDYDKRPDAAACVSHVWDRHGHCVHCPAIEDWPAPQSTLPCPHGLDDRRPAAEAGRADDDGGDVLAATQAAVDKFVDESLATTYADAEHERTKRKLAEVTGKLAEARAKAVDGGEWQWGVRTTWDDGTITDGWYRDEAAARRVAAPSPVRNQVIRRQVGPVTPVTDDGAAP